MPMAKSGADIAEVTVKYSVEWLHAYEVKITPIPNDPDLSSEEYSEIEDEDESSEKAEEQAKEDEDHTEGGDAEVVGSSFLLSAVPMFRAYQSGALCGFEKQGFFSSKADNGVPPLAPSDTSLEVEGLTTIFKTGPPFLAKRSPDKPKKVAPLHTDNAALPAEVLKESNPPQLEEQETTSPMPQTPPEDKAFMSLEPTFNPPAHIEVPNSLDEIDYLTLPAIVARPSHLEKSVEDNAPVNPKPASQNPLKRWLQKLAQSSAQQELQEGSLDEADTSRPRNPTEPPLVALGVGGGGFGEMPNESFKVLANGIAHIGVLEVEEDYGCFVKVDSRLWNKEVAVFVGEWYSKPCDQCKKDISSFGPTLEVVAQKAESMISKIRQFLAGLDILEDAQVVQDQVASLCQSV
ncbi:hypothetical protein IW261DRAFT_1423928 [Armillaria novae-zelandiae]|uniref:Uncharacterized protein n=1 Tax=Armillaria novae-zelandiae TaxID=153914 RepID=A0AA39U2I0_9AGAR|nr:hypothetical protein IW261DRAFT_1423928 [Armillaria novae-zelandiae]